MSAKACCQKLSKLRLKQPVNSPLSGVDRHDFAISPRVKLFYDIYHTQIMEGDLIATIRENIDVLGHFHTGGVPGRHEIDRTQEIHYPALMEALVDLNIPGTSRTNSCR